jgi:hypothetical protein
VVLLRACAVVNSIYSPCRRRCFGMPDLLSWVGLIRKLLPPHVMTLTFSILTFAPTAGNQRSPSPLLVSSLTLLVHLVFDQICVLNLSGKIRQFFCRLVRRACTLYRGSHCLEVNLSLALSAHGDLTWWQRVRANDQVTISITGEISSEIIQCRASGRSLNDHQSANLV